jgi:hypothetical protein
MKGAIVMDDSLVYYVYILFYPDYFPFNPGLPCYIGKGKERRAHRNFDRDKNMALVIISRLCQERLSARIVQENMSEIDALSMEQELINKYKSVLDGGTLVNSPNATWAKSRDTGESAEDQKERREYDRYMAKYKWYINKRLELGDTNCSLTFAELERLYGHERKIAFALNPP